MWFQPHWMNGQGDLAEKDFGPEWCAANEIRAGYLMATDPDTNLEAKCEAVLLKGSERDRLCQTREHVAIG